jgi:hypothetical protein
MKIFELPFPPKKFWDSVKTRRQDWPRVDNCPNFDLIITELIYN